MTNKTIKNLKVAFTKRSSNRKIGSIPCTTSAKATCPDACPLKDSGCYASSGYYTNMHWDKVSSGERGESYGAFLGHVAKLPEGQLWRHNVAGDLLPSAPERIDEEALLALAEANTGRKGFTYTHYPVGLGDPNGISNMVAIERANVKGFTVNISTNSITEALEAHRVSTAPVVTLVTEDDWEGRPSIVREGTKIVRCPAETRDDVSCDTCRLCSHAVRTTIVGFTAHGKQKKKVLDIIAKAV